MWSPFLNGAAGKVRRDVDFNAEPDEVPVLAIRGQVEDTGNGDLAGRVLAPIENSVAEPSRYTLFHHGNGNMLDHMLVTRNLLAFYRGSEIHNELLHDESAAFAEDKSIPSPTTRPSLPHSTFPNALRGLEYEWAVLRQIVGNDAARETNPSVAR